MKINIHTSHPSAFISSTFVDLYDDRQAVATVLKNRGLNVNALDVKPASNSSSKQEILSGIRESDFIILIIGDRYGSILNNMTGNSYQSITWWEYIRARTMGKPVLAYFKEYSNFTPENHDNADESNYKLKRKKFEEFKNIVIRSHNPAYYRDPYELAEKVDKSLINIYREGVKKLLSKNEELVSKFAEIESGMKIMKAKETTSNETLGSVPSRGLQGLLLGLGNTNDLPKSISSNPLFDIYKDENNK